MARGTVSRLSASTLLAILVVGCGSASTQSSPSTDARSPHSGARTTAADAVTASDLTRYEGHGFSFLGPSGLKPTSDRASGAPPGASIEFLTVGGQPINDTNTQIIEGINPHLHFDIDQVATNLRAADAANPSLKDVHTAARAVTVPGAEAARLVIEHYKTRHPAVAFQRTWLMVMPKPGTLIDLVVVLEPGHGATLNPDTVLSSFRLDGH